MPDWYEYQVGFYVEAESDEEALKKALEVVTFANKVDPEEDAQLEQVGFWPNGNVEWKSSNTPS